MKFFDVWQNLFLPLLAGIPLLILILFACCTCVDKSIIALRRSWVYYRCKPRTPRRVRFDCESNQQNGHHHGSHQRLIRSGTSPQLSGLMAHSTYLQSNSNYRYNSVVHSDRHAAPIHARTVLDRGSLTSIDRDTGSINSSQPPNAYAYHTKRRSSTPTPSPSNNSCPPPTHYATRDKSPIETGSSPNNSKHLDVQRRYSTPNSPTMYGYGSSSPKREDSNYSSISYLPEVRAYLQFMELDSTSRQRSQSFSGRNSSRNSSRRSSRRSSRHRPRSRSPSPYALERTAILSASDETSNYSSPSSYGRYLTPQGSSDQGSFKSPESGTPDWLDADMDDLQNPPSYEDCLTSLSRSSSIKTSFI